MPAAMFKFRRLERTSGEVAAVVARCGETSLPDLSGWTATRDGQSSRSTSRRVHWCGLCWRQRDANGNFWGDGACKVTHAWAGMRDCFALATECGRARASHLLVAALPDLTLFRLPHSFSCTILRNPAPLRPSLRLPLCRLPVVLWTCVFLLPIRPAATLRPDTIDRGLRTALSEQAAAEPSSYYSLRPPGGRLGLNSRPSSQPRSGGSGAWAMGRGFRGLETPSLYRGLPIGNLGADSREAGNAARPRLARPAAGPGGRSRPHPETEFSTPDSGPGRIPKRGLLTP